MNLIDVTLRDGGHCLNFEWPFHLASRYLEVALSSDSFSYIELGYWRQSGKFSGDFYSLNPEIIDRLPDPGHKAYSVMADYHYVRVAPSEFPDPSNSPIALLRLTSRKEDVAAALQLLNRVKSEKGLAVSLNLFNISNYFDGEVRAAIELAVQAAPDFVCFADTHGALRLWEEKDRFQSYVSVLQDAGIQTGFHLHNHSGFAVSNFLALRQIGVDFTDVSLGGMGKGAGNLRLEEIIDNKGLVPFLDLLSENIDVFHPDTIPFHTLTGRFSTTDHYAEQAMSEGLTSTAFIDFLQSLSLKERDNFNPKLMTRVMRR